MVTQDTACCNEATYSSIACLRLADLFTRLGVLLYLVLHRTSESLRRTFVLGDWLDQAYPHLRLFLAGMILRHLVQGFHRIAVVEQPDFGSIWVLIRL
jgi:hypothetical protein